MTLAVDVRGARVSLGGREVLRSVDLPIEPGAYVVLLGPTGCGKTTLLRCIAGLQPLDAGTIALEGAPASDPGVRVPPEARRVGMLFQNLALWPHLTASGHLEFVMRARGVARAERRRRAAELLDRVRLGEKAARRPSELSGGEAQRLALARALATEPRLLLLDEPLGAVDEQLRASLASELRELVRGLALPVLHVTHDQSEGLSLADEVAVLHDGRIEQRAAPETIYRAPATAFVAEFVGKCTLLRARVEGDRVLTALGEFPRPRGASGALVAAVRPEDLALDGQGVDARVIARAFEGGSWVHRVVVGDVEVRVRSAVPAAVGAAVRVRVSGDVVILPEAP